MANIKIAELQTVEFEFAELSDLELEAIVGGKIRIPLPWPLPIPRPPCFPETPVRIPQQITKTTNKELTNHG